MLSNRELRNLIIEGKQHQDFTSVCLKSTLNILSFKQVLTLDTTLEESDIIAVNNHINQKEFYTVFKLSYNEHSTFSDMLLAEI